MTDFQEAADRIIGGLEKKNRTMNQRRRKSSPTMNPGMRSWR